MKIKYIQIGKNKIAKNPLSGDWFVWIGDKKAADFICRSKSAAIATAEGKA